MLEYQINRSPTILHDEGLTNLVSTVKKRIEKKDDDFLLMIVAPTGTGKSSLALHIYELYDKEGCDVEYVALDQETFASGLKKVSTKDYPRFLCMDEANINKRNALSKFNKKLIDLYFAIRGLNIFHVWCNPSLDIIDKPFIEEKLNGIIFTDDKAIDRPRLYWYFTRDNLLKIFEKEGNLKLKTLRKCRKTHASYRGWFRKYEGWMWKPYLDKKESRMIAHVDKFFEDYKEGEMPEEAEKYYSNADVARYTLLSPNTIKKKFHDYKKECRAVEGEHYVLSSANQARYTKKGFNLLAGVSKE